MKFTLDTQERLDYVSQTAIEQVPDGWAKIEVVAHMIGDYQDLQARYWQKGKAKAIDFDPDDPDEEDDYYNALNIMDDIRTDLVEQNPQEGAWLEMKITILPDLTVDYEFDYMNPPETEIELEEEDWIIEFESFPRKKKYTPDWWLEILERNGIEVKD